MRLVSRGSARSFSALLLVCTYLLLIFSAMEAESAGVGVAVLRCCQFFRPALQGVRRTAEKNKQMRVSQFPYHRMQAPPVIPAQDVTSGHRCMHSARTVRHCSTTHASFSCRVLVMLCLPRTSHMVSMEPLYAEKVVGEKKRPDSTVNPEGQVQCALLRQIC